MSRFCEPCLAASKETLASHKCAECAELYCKKCSDDHTKFRALRKHTTIVLKQILSEQVQDIGQRTLPQHRQQHSTESVYEEFILPAGVKQLELSETEIEKQPLNDVPDDLLSNKKALYVGSDELEAAKMKLEAGSEEWTDFYSVVDIDQPVNHFYIDVEDTPLSRAIGIRDQRCLLVICKEIPSLSVSVNDSQKFGCNLKVIKRYGHVRKRSIFSIDFGRKCQYGAGLLQFKIENGQELVSRLKEAETFHSKLKQ